MNKILFQQTCEKIINQAQEPNGIGTLSEKTVHAVIKHYFSPNEEYHEVKVGGFVADIYNDEGIIEIQTRNFDKLRRKLQVFLTHSPVTIVYPIPSTKWIRWINPQSGEVSPQRKSPKLGSPFEIFPELYKIKDFLSHPNLTLSILLINMEEYRFLDGWSKDKKKGSTRCDRIPTELVNEIKISNTTDYRLLIPDTLEGEFTSKDYKLATKLPLNQAQTALNILHYIGVLERIGKRGRLYLYSRVDS